MHFVKRKLGIIGTVGVPSKYGGFETLVHHLVLNLNEQFDITVYCSKKAYSESERVEEWNGAKMKYLPFKANGVQSIIYDLVSIVNALIYCDTLLILGVSGCLFLPILKLFSKKKIIVNIDGLEWRRPKWNRFAKSFLMLSEKIACKYADEIVTDNRMIKEYAKIRYDIEGNLIEYGSDHNDPVEIKEEDKNTFPFLKDDYGFKVSRIEPENNIHTILEVFANIKQETLVLVGNWSNNNYGIRLKEKYSKYNNLILLDPIYEANTLNLLRSNAKYYVHGHSAGGTNPSLVEAMYLQLPVISFDVIYNRVTTNNEAIFFTDATDLYQIIMNIDQQPLAKVAKKLKRYADKNYTWNNISQRYARLVEGAEVAPVYPLDIKTVTFKQKKGLQAGISV